MPFSMTMQFYVSQDSDESIHVTNMVGAYEGQHHVHTPEDFEKWKEGIPEKYIHWNNLEAGAENCGCGLKPGEVRSGRS